MVKKQTSRSSRSGHKKGHWRPFAEALKLVHALDLKSKSEWGDYAQSGKRPADIPKYPPSAAYKAAWKGWRDWLGTTDAIRRRKPWRAILFKQL